MLQGMPSLGEILWLCHGARACHSSFELFAVTLVYVQAREEIPPPSVRGNLAIVIEII